MLVRKQISHLLHSMLKDSAVPVLWGPLQGWQWLPRSGNHAYWLGIYEKEYVRAFARSIQPKDVVFDIGAQAGYFSLIASRLVGSEGQVVAFEPFPQNSAFIQEHCRLNNCTNVRVVEMAVASSPRIRKFHAENAFMGHFSNTGSLEVKTVNLEDWTNENHVALPDVLKIDVEGMEYWVLKGGEKIIRQKRPKIFIATHGQENQTRTLQLLQEWQYEIEMIGNGSSRNADYVATPLPVSP